MIQFLVTFSLMFALDYVWVGYVQAVAGRKELASALWATTLVAFNGAVTIAYVGNHWLLLPVAAGAFAGTYVAVWQKNRSTKMKTAREFVAEAAQAFMATERAAGRSSIDNGADARWAEASRHGWMAYLKYVREHTVGDKA